MREAQEAPRIGQVSADGTSSIAVGGFIQTRLTLDREIDGAPVSLPRTRLYTFGHILDRRVRYRFMVGTPDRNLSLRVFDAYGEWQVANALRLRAGIFKIPALREWVESARLLASVERSIVTVAMSPGRGTGAMASGELGSGLSYAVGAFYGPESAQEIGPAVAARLVWAAIGRPIEGELDLGHSPLSLSLGQSSYARHVVAPTRAANFENEVVWGAELALRARGSDLNIEASLRRRTQSGTKHSDAGAFARFDHYFQGPKVSVGGRVSFLSLQDARRFGEYEIDLGWYPYGHQLKVAVDFGVRHTQGPRTLDPMARLQVQAAF
jgi:hypothetical protein